MARNHAVVVGAGLLLASPLVLAACGGKSTTAATTTTTVKHHVRRLPANAVRIHFKSESLVPATRAGRVCVVTYKTGHFCATYRSGERPAVALKRQLRLAGWVVIQSR